MLDAFSWRYQELGGELITTYGIDSSDSSVQDTANAIRDVGPELVYFAGSAENMARLLDAGIESTVIYGYGQDKEDLLSLAGDHAVGVFTVTITDDSEFVQALLDGFDAVNGRPPGTIEAAYAYDAAHIFLAAVENTASVNESGALVIDRTAIAEMIRNFQGTSVLGSALDCSNNGNCATPLLTVYINDGGQWTMYSHP